MPIFNIFKSIQRRVRWYIRQRMFPMSVDEAEEKREFFAKLYFIASFSAFTYLIYKVYQQKIENFNPSIRSGEIAVENFKIDGKVRILKFEGFKKVEDYYYERKKEEIDEAENQNLDPELIVNTTPNDDLRFIN